MKGVDCAEGLLNTSLATNRLAVLLINTCVLIIGVVVCAYASVELRTSVVLEIYQSFRWVVKAIAVVAAAAFVAAGFNLCGAAYRRKLCVKLSTLCLFVVFLSQFVFVILLNGGQDVDRLAVASDEEFLKGWMLAVAKINTENDGSGKYATFIAMIENEGSCCGYTSISDADQNPSTFSCGFRVPCARFFQIYIGDLIGQVFFPIYVALCVIQCVLLILQMLFIVKIEPIPDIRTEHGWTYKTIQN